MQKEEKEPVGHQEGALAASLGVMVVSVMVGAALGLYYLTTAGSPHFEVTTSCVYNESWRAEDVVALYADEISEICPLAMDYEIRSPGNCFIKHKGYDRVGRIYNVKVWCK